jgi:pyruvate kinase
MLAGETAVGRFPVRAVSTLAAILGEAERTFDFDHRVRPVGAPGGELGRAICEAAVTLAERANAVAIVALTKGGKTARMLAALRPRPGIIAATAGPDTAVRLSLVWGVRSVVAENCSVDGARAVLLSRDVLPAGSTVVFVSMHPALDRNDTNFVHVENL